MNRRMLWGVVVLCLLRTMAGAEEPTREVAATKAAEAWLKLVDDGKHEESWRDAAENFRAAVTREQWQQALKAVRTPLGATKSRKVKSATHKTSLPGAPDGEYVVIEFESSFENKAEAVETVTPMLDKDGVWRVSGYFIR
jgi:hypothetical protein